MNSNSMGTLAVTETFAIRGVMMSAANKITCNSSTAIKVRYRGGPHRVGSSISSLCSCDNGSPDNVDLQ